MPLFVTKKYLRKYAWQISLIAILMVATASNSIAQSSVTAPLTVSVTVVASPVPQSWIDSFFGAIDPDYAVTSTSDYDSDGQLDYYEYFAGTDPTNGASGLKIIETTLSGNDAEITWTSTNSENPEPRKYRIFRSGPEHLGILANPNATIQNLSANVNITPLELNGELEINSAGSTTTYIDINARNEFPLFYRVFLSKPEPQSPD